MMEPANDTMPSFDHSSQSTRTIGKLATLSPAYFGLVMSTGIVSIAAHLEGHRSFAFPLFYLNIAQFAILTVLYCLRAWRYPQQCLDDLKSFSLGPGFFTVVAGTGILASQFLILQNDRSIGTVLWLLTTLLWFVLTYTIFTIFALRRTKPTLEQGISGAWLLSVVATQSVSVSSSLLAERIDSFHRPALYMLSLSMWLWGGMLYIWLISLIFYRAMFFRISAKELTPPYWINMGAMAISTLAGAQLVLSAPHAPFLTSLLPFLKGFTIFYWATGTWWIPMLLLLGIWRYGFERYSFGYDPLDWSVVFPLGMYATCTWQMDQAMDLGFLTVLPRVFFWIALAAWGITFFRMIHSIVQRRTPTHN